MTKVLICWEHITSYIDAWIRAITEQNVEVMIVQRSGKETANQEIEAPLNPNCKFINLAANHSNNEGLFEQIIKFNADIAFISLSKSGIFQNIASVYRKNGKITVGCCDHFWRGSINDYLKTCLGRMGIHNSYECIWVPGALAKIYAGRIGFVPEKIFDGLYSCDTVLFRKMGAERCRNGDGGNWPAVFLFVGQYIKRKGIDLLVSAYLDYRKSVDNPWELWCAGSGSEKVSLQGLPGVRDLGFLSAKECAEIMGKAGAFCLPSRFDHWPLVIHEAVSSGLPVIASDKCGSTVELVQSGLNGIVFPAGRVESLTQAMIYVSQNPHISEMGRESLRFSYCRSSELSARIALVDIPFFLRGKPLTEL